MLYLYSTMQHCDVNWVFKFLIKSLEHKMLYFFLELEVLWLLIMFLKINNAINYDLQV